MKLFAKLKGLVELYRKTVGVDRARKDTDYTATMVFMNVDVAEQAAIVMKQNKGSVLLKCWSDGKETWVKKGSRCHVTGLCNTCLQERGSA